MRRLVARVSQPPIIIIIIIIIITIIIITISVKWSIKLVVSECTACYREVEYYILSDCSFRFISRVKF